MLNFRKNLPWLLLALSLLLLSLFFIFKPFNSSSIATSETSSHLRRRLKSEQSAIEDAFSSRFNFLSDEYSIDKVVLLDRGNSAALLLTLNNVTYRALLVKTDNSWSPVDLPYPVLSYANFPDNSELLIKTINNLTNKP